MKRLICCLLAMLMALSLCACGDEGGEYTPTEQQTGNDVEIPQEIWDRPWVSDPDQGDQRVEVHPNGKCVIGNTERTYTVVHQSETEVVLDAEGTELHFSLNPLGISELHVGGNWEVHYVRFAEYWNFLYKAWFSENRGCVEIFPSGVSMPEGYFAEFRCDTANNTVEVIENGQVIYTIRNGYHEIWVTDVDGNETHYTRQIESGDTPVIPGPGMDEPLDEEERLNLAYNKALSDYNAAISGQPVYDEEGNEIYDGPTLSEYLYNQFVALGDYEDAWQFLSHFKIREETVTTVRRTNPFNDIVSEYDEDLPQYDVLGRIVISDTPGAQSVGIIYEYSGNQRYQSVYDENNVLTAVIIITTNGFGDVINTCVADLEYNGLGQHIATHVAFVDENGNDVRYTSTLEYDNNGNLVRIDIPYYTRNEDTGTYTALYAYDEQGRLLRDTFVALPDDLDWYEHYSKRPFIRSTSKNVYDENGLLIEEYTCSHAPDTAAYTITTYSYDENGVLVNRTLYSYDYDFVGFIDSGDYTREEVSDLRNKFICDIFGLPEFYEDRAPESWVNNEDFDLSQWDWIPHTLEVNSEYTYTYDKTVTIMYIDLTPED